MNIKGFFAVIILIISGIVAENIVRRSREFKYFTIACSIYEKSGKLLFQIPNHLACAFAKNGDVLAINNEESAITLFDRNQNILWSQQEHLHHQPRFTRDEKNVLYISLRIIPLNGENVIDKCAVKRDVSGALVGRWCISEFLSELKERGLVFNRLEFVGDQQYDGIRVTKEISHINSVIEIPNSPLAKENPAFSEGNVLVNLQKPSRGMVILDPTLKKVLWVGSFYNFPIEERVERITTHDTQITEEGHMLTYANYGWVVSSPLSSYFNFSIVSDTYPAPLQTQFRFYSNRFSLVSPLLYYKFVNFENQERYSRLFEFHPLNYKMYFQYEEKDRRSFSSAFMGSINKLKNGNFLYSDITNGGSAHEITADGEKVWQFINPQREADGSPIKFLYINPIYDLSFLKARDLL